MFLGIPQPVWRNRSAMASDTALRSPVGEGTALDPVRHGDSLSVANTESVANVVRAKAAAGKKASPLRAIHRLGRPALVEAPAERATGQFRPFGSSLVEACGADFLLDTPALQLRADEERAVTPPTTSGDIVFREAPI